MNQHSLKVIILDFDGTMVDSNHIKDNAFDKIFSDWPTHKKTMMKWHLSSNTIDRREKFCYFVEEVLDMSGNEKLINKLTDRFSILTKKLIIQCPFVEGVKDFLDYFHNKAVLFLVSATPQDELIEITLARGLHKYFKQILGAPINKTETLYKIMIDEKVSANQMLYIGDSPEDQHAAIAVGAHYIARTSDRTLLNMSDIAFDDMNEILRYIKKNKFYNLEINNF